ncbi:hypothetical protein RR48_09790 [Papilio machaon]|uniref:Uncharacterized protein n=1 Tax=Papilio machaon TaxID=76193 RepID=A0A194R239_PAPMA|nr:hypothetical protein RR48_09790 [Papilio machaon]
MCAFATACARRNPESFVMNNGGGAAVAQSDAAHMHALPARVISLAQAPAAADTQNGMMRRAAAAVAK